MGKRENKVTDSIIEYFFELRRRGVWVWWFKVHGEGMQKAGVPDLAAVILGRAVYIEVKSPGEKATPKQLKEISDIRLAGGLAFVADSVEAVKAEIEPRLFDEYRLTKG